VYGFGFKAIYRNKLKKKLDLLPGRGTLAATCTCSILQASHSSWPNTALVSCYSEEIIQNVALPIEMLMSRTVIKLIMICMSF